MSPPLATRKDLARLFVGTGVELGVAGGAFSAVILKESSCELLWSIDRWSDHHSPGQCKAASMSLVRLGLGRCVPLRMTFNEAAALFAPESLDFVYIDGYAHTGQEDGMTLDQWWPMLKRGGFFAGHDYDQRWPKTVAAVDRFMLANGLRFYLTGESEPDQYPSWWTIKP